MLSSTGIVRLLGLLFLGALAGCHPVLGKPVIVGASASSGVGAKIDHQGKSVPVDLEAVYSSVIEAPHVDGVLLATGLVRSDPARYTQQQVEFALAEDPTCIFALDVLFWPAHQKLPQEVVGTEEEVTARLGSVREVLAQLDEIDVPIVLGLIPAVAHEKVSFLSEQRTPHRELLGRLNEAVRTWAAPRENVVLVDIGWLIEDATESRPLVVGEIEYDGTTARGFVQKDGLHPSAAGIVILLQLACIALEERGLIEPEDWERDLEVVLERLPKNAYRVARSREIGLFGLLSLERQGRRFQDFRERGECEEAGRVLDSIFTTLAGLPEEPDDWGAISLMMYFELEFVPIPVCRAEIRDAFQRQLDRLAADVSLADPNPWKLELWFNAATARPMSKFDLVTQRLLEARTDEGIWEAPFDEHAADLLLDIGLHKRRLDLIARLCEDPRSIRWALEKEALKKNLTIPFDTALPIGREIDPERNESSESRWALPDGRMPTERALRHFGFLFEMGYLIKNAEKNGATDLVNEMASALPVIVGDRLYVAYREHVLMHNQRPGYSSWVPPALSGHADVAPGEALRTTAGGSDDP